MEEFVTKKCVRQIDTVSVTWFKLTLQVYSRKVNKYQLNRRLEQRKQTLTYVDIILITNRREILNKMLEELTGEGSKLKLRKFGKTSNKITTLK